MRILLITHFFPPRHNAGTENYTLGLAKELISRGHTVSVLCAEDWNSGDSYWNGVTHDTYQGVPVYRIHLNWTKVDMPNRVLFDSPKVESWLAKFLDTLKPELIHITSVISLGVGVLRSAKEKLIPVVLTLTDYWFICQRTNLLRPDNSLCDGIKTPDECQDCLLMSAKLYRMTKSVLTEGLNRYLWNSICRSPYLTGLRNLRGKAFDMNYRKSVMVEVAKIPCVVISPSRFLKKIFVECEFPNDILYIPHGHDLSWSLAIGDKVSTDNIRVGYLGKLAAIKGVHILIQAFREIIPAGEATLDIWGDASGDKHYINQLTELIGDSELIKLRGRFDRSELVKVLEEIDVLVVPSLWYENAPLVIAEAFAAKIPVIASNIGGMAEAVTHEKNGLLFEAGSVNDLADQLRRIIEEPGLLEKLKQGIDPVKTFSQEVDELEKIYQGIIG